ncbi:PREDICTED: uncharacterized protein LOC108663961 [Theobroma cacao]|uniref:Uncharacterized protein LOC108663961 n=1 Tax=Theobroma cacao TaxID=3641 RepID=A0AB32X1B2_THECC|nr:PREDICTED: uncharacterized protein LOC108663961 [Theobroma cacao]
MFKVGTDVKIQHIMINLRECLAHYSSVEEEVDRKPWYHDIVHYLKFQQYPEQSSKNDKKTIKRLAMNFFLDGDILYRRSRDQVLLRCVDSAEARKIVEEVHEGICGAHANRIHTLVNALNVLTSPWPFSMWGMDVIGLITSKASNGHRFILVVIDYFTKWVEVASYANVTQKVVCKFIQKEIICRYGLLEMIIIDNASNLNGSMMKELPFALHAYRTTVRTSTGATPFSLVFGMEVVLPVEVEIPSLRVLKEVQLEEAEWVNARYEQLNLIEEKRLTALCHGQLYQKRMMMAYGKKVHPRQFQEGELVLKRIFLNQQDPRGKWTLNWEGPFVVKKAFSGGALILAKMDRREFSNPVNANVVKKYFA